MNKYTGSKPMNVGKLYENKKYFWMFYPSKDIAAAAYAYAAATTAAAVVSPAVATAAYYSNRFNCNVSYIKPSIFVLLEKDGEYIKVLSTNGELGWIILADWCKDDIEEVTV